MRVSTCRRYRRSIQGAGARGCLHDDHVTGSSKLANQGKARRQWIAVKHLLFYAEPGDLTPAATPRERRHNTAKAEPGQAENQQHRERRTCMQAKDALSPSPSSVASRSFK